MQRKIVTGILLAAVAVSAVAVADPAALSAVLAEREAEGLAFVAVIARGDEVVFAEAHGLADRKRDVANAIETAFAIGSITKTFTSAAIYRLVDAGKLRLDSTIDAHLDGVPEDKAGITIDQLIHHTSGLAQYHDRRGGFERMTRAQALERIMDAPLRNAPGEAYAYSNAGYTLLAILIERVTGQDYREYCREAFFDPLGMQHTGFYGEQGRWKPERVATGYGDSREGKNSPWYWRGDDLWAIQGNGGAVSTASDLLRWAAARERFFPSPDPPADLGARRRSTNGWYVATRPETGFQVFHGGASDKGFIAMLRSYPDRDTTLVLLSNTFKGKKPHIRTYLDAIEDAWFASSD